MNTVTLNRHADIEAALGDPRLVVPEAPWADRGVAWLRAHVSRFSTGSVHLHRRRLALAALDDVSPAVLRRRAFDLAMELPLALVPVAVLAEAMGVAARAAEHAATGVAAFATRYLDAATGATESWADADDAVSALVTILDGHFDEVTAARIGLLAQAHGATNGLVTNGLAAYARHRPQAPTDAVLIETLRHDPPVRLMRRVAAVDTADIPAETVVLLDIAAANRDPDVFTDPDRFDPHRAEAHRHLTLGAGIRPCPGGDHALAIAAGITQSVRATAGAADVR